MILIPIRLVCIYCNKREMAEGKISDINNVTITPNLRGEWNIDRYVQDIFCSEKCKQEHTAKINLSDSASALRNQELVQFFDSEYNSGTRR